MSAPLDCDPLGIFFLTSGTGGDRLLFRYPYEVSPGAAVKEPPVSENPYAVGGNLPEAYDIERIESKQRSTVKCAGHLSSYPDTVLANLLGMRGNQSGQKLQVKVNDVVFIGFPMQTTSQSKLTRASPLRDSGSSTQMSFNVVFALQSIIDNSVVQYYQNVAKQISIALLHEERRCGYLTQQKQIMSLVQDDINTTPEGSTESQFGHILRKSSLAKQLKQVYDNLCESGSLRLHINKWVHISFCLPPKLNPAILPAEVDRRVFIKPDVLQRCLKALRPYHTFLLFEREKKLLESLPIDSSPALVRLIRVASPLKNLNALSADADLSIQQVLQLVSHLVCWSKAAIIYPMCESNVYLLSPNCCTNMLVELYFY